MHIKELKVDLDVSDYIFILAGNAPIAETGNALMNRMETIDFGPMTIDARVKIACRELGTKVEDLPIGDKELGNVIEMAKLDLDQNVGIRSLLNTLDSYIQYLSSQFTGFASGKNFDIAKELDERSRSLWDPFVAFEMVKRKYSALEASLSPQIKSALLKEFHFIKYQYLGDLSASKSEETKIKAQAYFKGLRAILSLPQAVKNLATEEETRDAKLEELLADYPADFRDVVGDAARAHIAASNEEASVRKNVVFIHGKPGAGKTFFARSLAETLDLPLIELSLAGMSLRDLIGTPPYDVGLPIRTQKSDQDMKYSQFTTALLGKNFNGSPVKNAIIFIDEADKSLNSKGNSDTYGLYEFLLRL